MKLACIKTNQLSLEYELKEIKEIKEDDIIILFASQHYLLDKRKFVKYKNYFSKFEQLKAKTNDIKDSLEKGLHVVQIAKELKVSYSLLRKFIKKHNIEKPKRKKRVGQQLSQESP